MLKRSELQQLYQYSFALTKDSTNAYDLVQTALEKWVEKKNNSLVSDDIEYLPYIRKIIRNQYIDDCRRAKCVAFEPLDDPGALVMNEQSLEKQYIDESLVDQVMEGLNSSEREVLYLSAVMNYSANEIAEEMNTSRNTILSRLFRVKKKARTMMGKLGVREMTS